MASAWVGVSDPNLDRRRVADARGHQYIDVTRKPVFLKWLAHFPTKGE